MIDFLGNFIAINFVQTYIKRCCRCTHCTDKHCEKCETDLCATCITKENKDDNDHEDEDVNQGPVKEITFPSCGHISCNGFIELGDVIDYCRPCKIANSEREKQTQLAIQKRKKQTQLAIQKLLQKDDVILLKIVQEHFKSELFKTTVTNLLSHCAKYDAIEPPKPQTESKSRVIKDKERKRSQDGIKKPRQQKSVEEDEVSVMIMQYIFRSFIPCYTPLAGSI
jgi:hypothetical protein